MTYLAAVSLGLGDFGLIAGMLATFTGLMTTLMLLNLRSLNRRVERVEDRVDQHIRDTATNKVDKRDWLREALSTRQKVDRVGEQIAGIDKKLDAEFGVAAAINGLAERVTKVLEKQNGG